MKLRTSFAIPAFHIPLTMETLFLAVLGIYTFIDIWNRTNRHLDVLLNPLSLIFSLVLFGALMYNSKPTLKGFIISAVIFGLFITASLVTHRKYLIIYSMFIIAASLTDFQKIIKVSMFSVLSGFVAVFIGSKVGVVKDYIFLHDGEIAHGMGFTYYSTPAYVILFTTIMFLYLRSKDISWKEIITAVLVNFVIYKLATTRLAFLVSMIAIFLDVVLVKLDWFDLSKKVFRLFSLIAFPAMFLVTMYGIQHYNPGKRFWWNVDKFTSGRFAMSKLGFQRYDVKLFGNYIEMHGTIGGEVTKNYFYLDSGYVYALLGYGVIFTVLLLGMYTILYHKAACSNDKALFIWISCLLVFTIINNTWVTLTYNPILMLLFASLPARDWKKMISRIKQYNLLLEILPRGGTS